MPRRKLDETEKREAHEKRKLQEEAQYPDHIIHVTVADYTDEAGEPAFTVVRIPAHQG
jgi:hypothetical protein